MKREIISMEVGINKANCDLIFAKCSFPAGESGYCNHITVLLFEIADYSLHQLVSVPKKKHVLAWLEVGVNHQQIQLQNYQSCTKL